MRKKRTRLTGTGIGTFRAVALLSMMVAGANLNFTKFIFYLSEFCSSYGIAYGQKTIRDTILGEEELSVHLRMLAVNVQECWILYSGNVT